jgi:hypothetical protein
MPCSTSSGSLSGVAGGLAWVCPTRTPISGDVRRDTPYELCQNRLVSDRQGTDNEELADGASEDETSATETQAKEAHERARGTVGRHVPGFVVGVLASLAAFALVSFVPRIFIGQPDAEIGDRVSLGSFTYSVDDLDCGSTQFGSYSARGKFCIVTLQVANASRDADAAFPSEWTLEVGSQSFDPADWSGPGFDRLFPGESAVGDVAFDVPSEATPTALRLADFVGFLGGEASVRVLL